MLMKKEQQFIINSNKTLTEYNGSLKEIIVPEGVKSIGKWVFKGRGVEKIQLPTSLKKIGDEAFSECTKLKNIVIPEGTEQIGESAFAYSGVKEINLPSNLKKIGKHAFYECSHLSEMHWPQNAKKIEDNTFSYSGLKKIILPKELKKIGKYAFSECKKLESIEGVNLNSVEIGDNAFSGCNKLVDKNGLLIIQDRLFYVDPKKKKIDIPNNVKAIENDAFMDHHDSIEIELLINGPVWKYNSKFPIISTDGSTISFRDIEGRIIAKVILAIDAETAPKQLKAEEAVCCGNDGKFDFEKYDSVFSIITKTTNKIRMAIVRLQNPYELSEEYKEIYSAYLRKCSPEAGKIVIDNRDKNAFEFLCNQNFFTENATDKLIAYASHSKLVEVTAALMEYKNNHFKNIAHTSSFRNKKNTGDTASNSVKVNDWKKPKTGTNLISRYLGNEENIIYPESVDGIRITGIANTAGATPSNYLKIKSIDIPEGYKSIGNKVFAGCENLEYAHLPSSMREIGSQAFEGCIHLKELYIHNGISFKGNNTFYKAIINTMVLDTSGANYPSKLFNYSMVQK